MSRLYNPQPKVLGAVAQGSAAQPAPAKGFNINETAEKVAKLIPSELITAYTALISFAGNVTSAMTKNLCYGFSFVLCLVLTPIYLNKMADAGQPKKVHLAVSSVAFVVWAYFISGKQIFGDAGYSPAIASMILLGFSLISAAIPLNK